MYRFWIDVPGQGIVQAYPFNSQLKWIDKKRTGYRFKQRTLETALILKDKPADSIFDFTNLMNLERSGMTCTRVNITVDKYCDCDATWHEDFYVGYLRLNEGEWDVSNCTVTIPIVVDDKFTCLTTSWTDEINMFDYGDDTVTTSPFVGVIQYVECETEYSKTWSPPVQASVVRAYLRIFTNSHLQTQCLYDLEPGSDSNPWIFTNNAATGKVQIKLGDIFNPAKLKLTFTVKTKWAREFYAGVTIPDGDGWIAVTGGWARTPSTFTGPFYDDTTEEGQQALIDFTGSDDFNVGVMYTLKIFGINDLGEYGFPNGKELGPLLESLLEPCGLSVISNFLNINPDATAPNNVYYQNAAVDFEGIVLYQISDVARIDETQSATIAITQVKKILDALKVAGNLDIDIDGDTVRIEHLSYWADTVQMDLTLSDFIYLLNDKWKYTYDQDAQPKTEIIAWGSETDGKGKDFDGYPITYDNSCVNDKENKSEKVYMASNFLSNILKIIGNEDYYDDTETIVMMSTNGTFVINSAVQPISGTSKLNGNLAMGYLIPRYYRYGRPFKEGFINNLLLLMYRSLRLKLQAPITIPMDCNDYLNNYDPSGLIKTQLGAGEIESATYIDPDQTLEIKLRHK